MSLIPIKYKYEDHYQVLERWWKDHDWTPVHPAALPEGFLIKPDGGDYLCAGFLYKTGTAAHCIEWVISNPDSDKRERSRGLNMLIESLMELIPPQSVVVTWAKHEGLLKRWEKQGFIKADEGMTSMIKVVK